LTSEITYCNVEESRKESSMPTLTIVNTCDIPVKVAFNGGVETEILAGAQIARDCNGNVQLSAKPSGPQAGFFKGSGPAAQSMVANITLNVTVIDPNTAQLGFR
jgi:hypothetical protein